jgi:hypothetical protein
MTYSLYLDDGGHPADRPQVIASGFLSTEEKWLQFEPEWVSAVKQIGLGDVFHMTEFEGAFRGKPEKWDILNSLISIVMEHTEGTFISIVDMEDYRRVNHEYPLEECIGKPYAIAARCVAAGINQWKAEHFKKDDRLLVFIEDGTLHRGDMEEVFKRDALPVPQSCQKPRPLFSQRTCFRGRSAISTRKIRNAGRCAESFQSPLSALRVGTERNRCLRRWHSTTSRSVTPSLPTCNSYSTRRQRE